VAAAEVRRRLPPAWRLLPLLGLATAVAVLVLGVLLALYNERVYRAQEAREAGVQADILAASVTAALAFDDAAAAQEYVDALAANPQLEAAAAYDEGGVLVAGYLRPGGAPLPRTAPDRAAPAGASRATAVRPVAEGGVTSGAVYVRTITETLPQRLSRYAGIGLLVVMASLVAAVLAAGHAMLTRANAELKAANRRLRIESEERERAEEALRQSQKMEALGRLTGGVAHDFNNILMAATSGLELLERTGDPARRERLRHGIRQAVDRGAALTRQLLAFSRRAPMTGVMVDLGARIEGMRVLLERSLREDITVELRLPPDVWCVEVDPDQLEIALVNIAVNARDAMPEGGVISIGAQNLEGFSNGRLSGDFVRLWVTDTGGGVPPEVLSRVFEPFFTTKEVGKGTGLGLSQVYGFVHASGGEVSIESEAGEGTTVSMLLPRCHETAAAPAPSEPPPLVRGTGRVLLVDDDDAVAAVVADMLEELGYEPLRASTAAEALEVLERETVDLVLSDMVMPGRMDGRELARIVHARFPGLPVILTTGFSEAAAAARADGLRLLLKPYKIEALAQELSAARTAAPAPA
jgi:signal transduction histidine kinase